MAVIKMKYWNRPVETMDREELEKLQFTRFRNIFSHAYENSPAHRRLYDGAGIRPEDLRSFDDIRRVPLTGKQFITESLGEGGVYGSTLTLPPEKVVFYHQTSGTTSTPVPQPDSRFDWYYNGECWAGALWAWGVRAGDRVLIAFNYNLFIGFWQCHYGCEKIGAEIIPGGGLPTEVKLQKIFDLGVTVLASTPSYAFRMAETAEKLGLDLRGSPVKKIIVSGEPGGLVDGVKDKLQSIWGADVYDTIGATEVGSWGFECDAKSGGMHINEAFFLPEIIGLEDDEPVTGPGKYGRLVLTNFFRSARPCIRFNTNDIACWAAEPCPCGRSYRMIAGGIQGRADHILKVRGTFVNPVVVEDIINKHEKCSQEYQIIIHEDGSHITVHAEAAQGVTRGEFEGVARELAARIHSASFVRMDVIVMPYGSMPRSEAKSRRVVDLRKEKKSWNAQK